MDFRAESKCAVSGGFRELRRAAELEFFLGPLENFIGFGGRFRDFGGVGVFESFWPEVCRYISEFTVLGPPVLGLGVVRASASLPQA